MHWMQQRTLIILFHFFFFHFTGILHLHVGDVVRLLPVFVHRHPVACASSQTSNQRSWSTSRTHRRIHKSNECKFFCVAKNRQNNFSLKIRILCRSHTMEQQIWQIVPWQQHSMRVQFRNWNCHPLNQFHINTVSWPDDMVNFCTWNWVLHVSWQIQNTKRWLSR